MIIVFRKYNYFDYSDRMAVNYAFSKLTPPCHLGNVCMGMAPRIVFACSTVKTKHALTESPNVSTVNIVGTDDMEMKLSRSSEAILRFRHKKDKGKGTRSNMASIVDKNRLWHNTFWYVNSLDLM